MLNHNQFLLSIVSYSFYLFGEFEEVLILKGKSDAYKLLICTTGRKNRALEVPPVVPYKALEKFSKAL